MSYHVKFWGVRGSLPAAPTPQQWVSDLRRNLNQFFSDGHKLNSHVDEFIQKQPVASLGGFGSHTTCVEVTNGKSQIIIDGGSGLRNLGAEMMKGPCGKGQGQVHIFLTHFHWDHLLGIPFFAPHFVKGNIINYYAVQPELPEIVKIKFRKPMFPVPFEDLSAKINFHILTPRKSVKVGDFNITPYQLDHPDPCWGFKIDHAGKVYSHCVDTESTRVTREALGLDLPLYQGVDLMYFDAQYTLPELAEKSNWGHSAAQIGLDLAFREKINCVLFAHHDPGYDTAQIYQLRDQTQEYYDWKISSASPRSKEAPHKVHWAFVHEGLIFDMEKSHQFEKIK